MAAEPTETDNTAAAEPAVTPAQGETQATPPAAPWWKALPWTAAAWTSSSWTPGLGLPSLSLPALNLPSWPGGWAMASLGIGGEAVIESATDADLPYMADIHALSFAQIWSEDEIAALLASPGTFAIVARRASPFGTRRPIGFMIVRAAAGEAEVLTIAVDPAHRGSGIGSRLTAEALRRLYAERVEAVFLEVDSENTAALAVYQRQGFVQVGLRPGYYAHAAGRGHALVLRRDLR